MLPGVVLFAAFVLAPQAAPKAVPTADELLHRVRTKYASCKTYRERARVRTRKADARHWFRHEECSVAFARPDRFRFEEGDFTTWEYRGDHVAWREGNDWAWWGERSDAPIHGDSARAMDFVFRSAIAEWILPLLAQPDLLADPAIGLWDRMRATGAIARTSEGGAPAWRIDLVGVDCRMQLWIDDFDGVRRIELDRGGRLSTHEEIELLPEFDVVLSPEELALSPPADRGVRPSHWLLLLAPLGLMLSGWIGLRLSRRLQETGRPFIVAANVFAPAALGLFGVEELLRLSDDWEGLFALDPSAFFQVVIVLIVPVATWLQHRRSSGFRVFGIADVPFRIALRAAADGLGVHATVPAGGEKAKIDGIEFKIVEQTRAATVTVTSDDPRARPLVAKLRPLVASCIESESLPTDPATGARCARWSLATIAGGALLFAVAAAWVGRS